MPDSSAPMICAENSQTENHIGVVLERRFSILKDQEGEWKAGIVYADPTDASKIFDESLHIELAKDGEWHLQIANLEWIGELDELDDTLREWAESEGYFLPPKAPFEFVNEMYAALDRFHETEGIEDPYKGMGGLERDSYVVALQKSSDLTSDQREWITKFRSIWWIYLA